MHNLSKFIGVFFPLRDFLYILQLEEYDIYFYVQQLPQRVLRRGFEKVDQINWTFRVLLTALATLFCYFFILVCLFQLGYTPFGVVLILTPFLIPLLIIPASLIVSIGIAILTEIKISRAHDYFISHYSQTSVIAITGSYGKTTTKYLLYELLKHTYPIAIIPDNINTTLGIAHYILQKKIDTNSKYVIVEMGAYRRGDIRKSCRVLRPDISIITALADQHIVRFGNFENLVSAKNEIFDATPHKEQTFAPSSVCSVLGERKLLNVATKCAAVESHSKVPILEFAPELTANVAVAIAVAKFCAVKETFIEDTLLKFTPPSRRKQLLTIDEIEVIDASYNISPSSATSAIDNAYAYAAERNKALVVVTGGIPEQGIKSKEVNEFFGTQLNQKCEKVVITNTIYEKWITPLLTNVEVIHEANQMKILSSLHTYAEAHNHIVLLLPTLPDQYYL